MRTVEGPASRRSCLVRWARGRRLGCEAFGLVAEEEAVDEAFDEFFVLVCEALGGF